MIVPKWFLIFSELVDFQWNARMEIVWHEIRESFSRCLNSWWIEYDFLTEKADAVDSEMAT